MSFRLVRPVTALAVALVCVATLGASQPAALTDQEFWSFITEVSETGGNYHADNFTSNEAFADNAAALSARRPGGAYLGVGPEQNFQYIVALRPQIAFIVDIRRQAMVQHLLFKALFELSADRADFIARLFSRRKAPGPADQPLKAIWDTMPAEVDEYRHLKNHGEIVRHLTVTHGFGLSADERKMLEYVHGAFFKLGPAINYAGFPAEKKLTTGNTDFVQLSLAADRQGIGRSFLATEANYQALKAMQAKNLVIPVQGDFGGPKTIRAIGAYLRERKILVNAFYISNVEQYLLGRSSAPTVDINGGHKAFRENLATLPIDAQSVLVRWPVAGTPGAPPTSICSFADFLKMADGPKPPVESDLRRCIIR